MRIDLRIPYDPGNIEPTEKPATRSADAAKQAAVPGASSDHLQLSNLETSVTSAPDIRQERVQQLRDAIQSGTYSVSDEQLAHAMLKDLLNR